MSRFVRPSKYRHVFGQPGRKENSIENVKVSGNAWDTNIINASGTYISLNWQASGGGAFAILPAPSPFSPYTLPYKLPDVIPLARGHSATVLDTAWSPFNDSLCVSGGEDGKILIWKVEQSAFADFGAEKWVPHDFDPVARIAGSARRIGQVFFHPTASNVLATASGDYAIKLWDLENADDPVTTFKGHGDSVQSLTFNHNGNLLATTCRDRKLRIFDTRAGVDAVRITDGHGGIKGSRVVWMGDKDRIATTGFSKMSDRQLAIWDTASLKNVVTQNVDQSAGVVMPFWSDNGILFLAGKGDGNIRSYEYEADNLYELSEYKSSDPQRGMCFLPRRALNVSDCEIGRAFKVSGSSIEPIAFIVPRKADSFQSDIFPPAPSLEPALTASEFFHGKSAEPNMVNLETGAISASSAASPATSAVPKYSSSIDTSVSAPTKTASAPAAMSTPTTTQSQGAPPVRMSSTMMAELGMGPAAASPTIQSPPAASGFGAEPESSPFSPMQDVSTTVASPLSMANKASEPSSGNDSALQSENDRLRDELRESKNKIRNLELQVETMRANAQRAAKALQLE